ncbi:hypothetical protein DOTSEDRAFT_24079 [Dothistroma septosporum NZE10]|uniref:Uncharacterized protein n=1 Tax=Dothistroma septosporum (strain NZE10 / CBS 128990) TaxID=675120 RepID=N1PNL1_DOTSN|nr:hypothetical protein DOTSEDRAFT_24079 [Dothistroma septosporum NZE10]
MSTGGDQGDIVASNKANLDDKNSSEESKQHSKQILNSINSEGGDILAAHKATANSANASDEVKERSRKILEEGEGGGK